MPRSLEKAASLLPAVYPSFLRHVERAADEPGLDTRAILVEIGKRKMVGGPEDMIADVALDIVMAWQA